MIINIVGARPNFIKISPLIREMDKNKIPNYLVHTGQHYDWNMSGAFFKQLNIPTPDKFLNVGSSSHAKQTSEIIEKFEKICLELNPSIVLVVGDVNSTIACALVASKLNIKVAHVEAGLRSFDKSMPEEINRILTDHVSDFLFVTEQSGLDNLVNEGFKQSSIHFVGNCMIDTLIKSLQESEKSNILYANKLESKCYFLATFHRASNVDRPNELRDIVNLINKTSENLPVVFPVHPRTKKKIIDFKLKLSGDVITLDPLPYLDFIKLLNHSKLVITDSGGIQEESTFLGIPCITCRENTERPITIDIGTNILVGSKMSEVGAKLLGILENEPKENKIPPLWDGLAAKRIVKVLKQFV